MNPTSSLVVPALSRRGFIQATSLSLAAVLAASGRARAGWRPGVGMDDTYFEWKKVGEGVHVATGEGGNTMVVLGKKDAMVVDAKNAGFGDTLYREANLLAGLASIRLLVNTHHHADHTGGNSAFMAHKVAAMSHAKARDRIRANFDRYMTGAKAAVRTLEGSDKPAAKKVLEEAKAFLESNPKANDFVPTQGMEIPAGETRGLPIADQKVDLIHVGPGHTDNDVIVYLTHLNIVHTGDLVFNQMWPFIDRPGGATTQGWEKSLNRILQLCTDNTVVVPGHGAVTDRSGVQRQIDSFKHIRELAEKAVKDGQSKEDFQKLMPDEYKDYAAADSIRPMTLGGMYDEVKGVAVDTAVPAAGK